MFKRWMKTLLNPSPSHSMLFLLAVGVGAGIVGVFAFNTTMHATSTEAFCISCHDMEIPYAQLQKTAHYNNASGCGPRAPTVTCPGNLCPR